MQALFALVLIYAIYKAIATGIPAGLRATRTLGHRRWDEWRRDNPTASTPAVLGQRAATWAAGLRYGPGFVKREMTGAFRDGWADGKRRWALANEAQNPQPTDPQPEPTPTTPAPAPAVTGRLLRPVPTPSGEGPLVMTIKTATGGEITTPESLLAELQAIRAEAIAEREDAIGDALRADEDLARIDRMVGCLGAIRMRPEQIAQIAAMRDSAAARKDAAASRAAAADLRVAQTNTAVDTATQHLQLMGQAAGAFYGN